MSDIPGSGDNSGQLQSKRILLGVSGGIAAYKSAELVRRLRDAGADVRVVLTSGAEAFVSALTFQALSGNPVHSRLLDSEAEAGMGHIELARWADLVLVAPASANLISRLAGGAADDLLTTLCLATEAPLLVAPSMNRVMWNNAATQQNLQLLRERGVDVVAPASGSQACGDVGVGRLPEPAGLVECVRRRLAPGPLQGRKVLITAGPTRERIDPVRYLGNDSSGKMGFALAEASRAAGADVVLVAGPVVLETPVGVQRIDVESARQMLAAVERELPGCDLFVAAAAVADFEPVQASGSKIKKQGDSRLTLELRQTPDILARVGASSPRPLVVGFAAETGPPVAAARDKLQRKRADMIVANDVSAPGIGFGSDRNAVTLVFADREIPVAETSKREVAQIILTHCVGMLADAPSTSTDASSPCGATAES